MVDVLASLRGQAEQAEMFTVESEATLVSLEANEVKLAQVEETQGIALRAVVGGKLGFTAASGQPHAEQLIEPLLASARYGEEVPIVFPPPACGPFVETFDPLLAETPITQLLGIGQEIVQTLRAVDDRASIHVDVERSIERVALRNSAGMAMEGTYSSLSVGITVERVRGNDVLILYDEAHGISLACGYHEAVERLAHHLRLGRRRARLRSGQMPVLFSPAGGAVLSLPLVLATDGKNVQRGISPLAGKRGRQVLDEKITIWDDPTLPGRPDSSGHDDEGVPCGRTSLIERGVCAGYLLDLRTAALMGVESTGNGARSLFSAPTPEPSNLVWGNGSTPLADMIAEIDYGLLVEDVLGLGQGNEISGSFSNALGLAYLIEKGEIVGRVTDASIAGNVYEILREVAAVSQECHWVEGNTRMPYILVPEMNVVSL